MSRTSIVVVTISMVIFTFLTVLALVIEDYRGRKVEERAKEIKQAPAAVAVPKDQDYSIYKTIIGGDGREMVLIPAGPFTMGGGPEGDFDEQPQREIYLDAFYMDKYEVDNANYRRFVKMTKRHEQFIPVFEDDVNLLMGDQQPAVGVTWLDAQAYCQWAGKRLPTEAEWEKAARGTDGREYPWGDQFDPRFANGNGEEDGYKYTAPVKSFEEGRSPYGLYNMAGNASEWVNDWYDQFYYKTAPFKDPKGPETGKVLVYRGGSFNNSQKDLRASKRFGGGHPERADSTIGFRCARDPQESQ
jgi:formylglycine-generating enzyme required for sulfatase activity